MYNRCSFEITKSGDEVEIGIGLEVVEVAAEIRHRGSDPGRDTLAGHSIPALGRSTVSFRPFETAVSRHQSAKANRFQRSKCRVNWAGVCRPCDHPRRRTHQRSQQSEIDGIFLLARDSYRSCRRSTTRPARIDYLFSRVAR